MKIIKRIVRFLAAFAISLFFIGAVMVKEVKCGTIYTNVDDYIKASQAEAAEAGYTLTNDMSEFYGTNSSSQQTYAAQPNKTPTTSAATPQPEKKPVKTCEHAYEDVITKEPTCSEDGEMVSTCNKCGDSYKTVLAKTGEHEYEEKVTKEATCTADGEKTFACKFCGESYTEPIPATGHEYEKSVTKQAQCTEAGELTYKCKLCGDAYTEAVPATGHSQTSSLVTKEAGLFTEGEKVVRCDVCGETLSSEQISSTYPVYYLYAVIAAVILLGIIFAIVVTKKKKVHKIA